MGGFRLAEYFLSCSTTSRLMFRRRAQCPAIFPVDNCSSVELVSTIKISLFFETFATLPTRTMTLYPELVREGMRGAARCPIRTILAPANPRALRHRPPSMDTSRYRATMMLARYHTQAAEASGALTRGVHDKVRARATWEGSLSLFSSFLSAANDRHSLTFKRPADLLDVCAGDTLLQLLKSFGTTRSTTTCARKPSTSSTATSVTQTQPTPLSTGKCYLEDKSRSGSRALFRGQVAAKTRRAPSDVAAHQHPSQA
ncbi:hypothetical protein IW261DRAFT_1422635 [Armillaria novae-zelandiae]|uniref:Uncharacterized protein n=1 Tax=Armillaria novae-zelandiae TaxID=153914 RepID=A0AA39UA05_9AGAR|nr:hypothetical protein IW261DRAFT_1422635 [Armillaria novae-zelandiae]